MLDQVTGQGVDVDSIADNALHVAISHEIGAVGALITDAGQYLVAILRSNVAAKI